MSADNKLKPCLWVKCAVLGRTGNSSQSVNHKWTLARYCTVASDKIMNHSERKLSGRSMDSGGPNLRCGMMRLNESQLVSFTIIVRRLHDTCGKFKKCSNTIHEKSQIYFHLPHGFTNRCEYGLIQLLFENLPPSRYQNSLPILRTSLAYHI